MTTVNWERLSGETVQELTAALVLMSQPHGNLVTASRGDRGVDIRVMTPAGLEVYQVKKYPRPLTSKQASEVKDSWLTFVEKTVPFHKIAGWHLVMPWNPTNERLDWLATLTAGYDFPRDWHGRTQLDTLAAENPRLVAYYLGDGRDRLQELLASVLSTTKEPSAGSAPEQLLDAAIGRHRGLINALEEVDPFYRYEIQVRPGTLATEGPPQTAPEDDLATIVTYRYLDESSHLAIKIFPQGPGAGLLRPIQQTLMLQAPDEQTQAEIENFHRYGAPLQNVPVEAVTSSGPPGATVSPGARGVLFTVARNDASQLDLELRVDDRHGQTLERLRLYALEYSAGVVGRGQRVAGWDRSKTLRVEVLMGADDVEDSITLSTSTLHGKPVTQLRDVARFLIAAQSATQLQLAFESGLTVGGAASLTQEVFPDSTHWATLIDALARIQRHTYTILRSPRRIEESAVTEIGVLARLLEGDSVVRDDVRSLVIPADEDGVPAEGEAKSFYGTTPLTLDLEGETIPFDRVLVVHTPHCKISRHPACGDQPSQLEITADQPFTFTVVTPQSEHEAAIGQ